MVEEPGYVTELTRVKKARGCLSSMDQRVSGWVRINEEMIQTRPNSEEKTCLETYQFLYDTTASRLMAEYVPCGLSC